MLDSEFLQDFKYVISFLARLVGFLARFLQDFKYVISFLSQFVELPNIGSKKSMFFAIYCYDNAKKDVLKNLCSYSECSSLMYCAFFFNFTKFWVL